MDGPIKGLHQENNGQNEPNNSEKPGKFSLQTSMGKEVFCRNCHRTFVTVPPVYYAKRAPVVCHHCSDKFIAELAYLRDVKF